MEARLSFSQTIFNCLSLLFGLGMLACPYAVQKAGWITLLLGLVCVPLVYFCTALLLKACLERHADVGSYQDLSRKAYGKRGSMLFTSLLFLEVYATLVSYAVSLGDTLVKLLVEDMGNEATFYNRAFLTGAAAVIVLPTVWFRNLRALSLLSAGSLVSAAAVTATLVWLTATDAVEWQPSLVFANPVWIPVSTSIFLFNYSGHVVLPSIYLSMEHKSNFIKAITISFAMATIAYAGLGLLGSLIFGEDTESQVTLNLPSEFLASKVALWLTVIVPITKFALLFYPLSSAVNRAAVWSPTAGRIASSCIAMSAFMVALLFPAFSYVLSLIGATLSVSLCVVFPCLFYIKLMEDTLTKLQLAFCSALAGMAILVGLTCTVFSVRNFIIDSQVL